MLGNNNKKKPLKVFVPNRPASPKKHKVPQL